MTPQSMEPGQTQIVVYLTDVTDEQVEALFDGITDLVAAQGLGIAGEDDDVRCLVGLRPEAFPDFDDEAALGVFLDKHVRFSIPVAPGAEIADDDDASDAEGPEDAPTSDEPRA